MLFLFVVSDVVDDVVLALFLDLQRVILLIITYHCGNLRIMVPGVLF